MEEVSGYGIDGKETVKIFNNTITICAPVKRTRLPDCTIKVEKEALDMGFIWKRSKLLTSDVRHYDLIVSEVLETGYPSINDVKNH
jgi:hypothetical protein